MLTDHRSTLILCAASLLTGSQSLYTVVTIYMYVLCGCDCRVCAPERERKVCGLAARQKVKLGRILDQVHCDIIAERQAGITTL